jgi:hypothetical protein
MLMVREGYELDGGDKSTKKKKSQGSKGRRRRP